MASYGPRPSRTQTAIHVLKPEAKVPAVMRQYVQSIFTALRTYNTVHQIAQNIVPVHNDTQPHYKWSSHLTLDGIGKLIVLMSSTPIKENNLLVKTIFGNTMALPINLSKQGTWRSTMIIKATQENQTFLYDYLKTNLAPNGATPEYHAMLDLLKFVTEHSWESKIHGSNDETQNTAAGDVFNLLIAVYKKFVALNLQVVTQEVSSSTFLDVITSTEAGKQASDYDKNFDEMMLADTYSSWVAKKFEGDFKAAIRSIKGNEKLSDELLTQIDADLRTAERGSKPVQPEERSEMSMMHVGQGFRNKTLEAGIDNRWMIRLDLLAAILNGSAQTFLRATEGGLYRTVDGNNRGYTYADAVAQKQMSYVGEEVFLNSEMLHSISRAQHQGEVYAPHQANCCRKIRLSNAISRPLPQMNTTMASEVLARASEWSAATANEQLQAVMRPWKTEADMPTYADVMVCDDKALMEHPASKKFDRSLLTKLDLTGENIGDLLSYLFLKGMKARAKWPYLADRSEVGMRYYAANQVSALQVAGAHLVINQASVLSMWLLTNELTVDESDLDEDRLSDFKDLWTLYGKVAQVAFAFQKKQKGIEHGSTLSDLYLSRIFQKLTEFIYYNTEGTKDLRLNDAHIEQWVEFFVVFDNKYLVFLWTKEMSAPENQALCESGNRVLRSMHADDFSLTNKTVGQTALRRLSSFVKNTFDNYFKSRTLYIAQVEEEFKAVHQKKGGRGGAAKRSRNDVASDSSSDIRQFIDVDDLDAIMSAQEDPMAASGSGSQA